MTELDRLFEEEEKIQESVREISQGLLDLSDYSLAKSAVDLAEAQVVGKRIRNACDKISEQVHVARKKLGALLTNSTKVKFKKAEKPLHEMENELSLIHGDLEAIGQIAEDFYGAKNRKAAFENLNRHYSELIQHVTSLMIEESNLKQLV
jgi:hypothetical protein